MPTPRLTILLGLIVAACLLPQSALAGRWLPSEAISQDGASAPLVAMGPQGNATIVFMRNGQLRAVGRAPHGDFKSLGALSDSSPSSPDITAGRSGAVGVTWLEQTAGGWEIRSARRTGSGDFRDRRAAATSSAQPHTPRIDLDGSGDPTVAWTVDRPGADQPRRIRIATGSAGGAYGSFDSSSADENFLSGLGLKVDDAGNATLAWQSRPCMAPGNCPQWQVHAASRPPGGAISPDQLTESSADATFTPRPALGIDAAGDVTAAWRIACSVATPQCAPTTTDGQLIRTATRDAAAPLFAPPATVSNDVGPINGPIALAVGPSGEGFAGWVPDCAFGCRPTASRRRALHSFFTPESLDVSQGDGIALAAGGSGRVLSVWRRGDDGRIRARAGGAATGWETRHVISASGASNPQVAQDASGNGVAVFERGGKIRAALFDDQPPVIDSVHVPKRPPARTKGLFTARVHDDFTSVRGHWDFGTTSTASGLRVRHAYRSEGSYEVTFTAVDAAGNRSSVTRTVHVRAKPDRQGPKIRLRVKRRPHHKRILMGLHVRVLCSESCLVRATMRSSYLIAHGRRARDRRGTAHIFLKPRGRARRRFRANPPASAVIRVRAIDYAGNRSKPRSKRVYIR